MRQFLGTWRCPLCGLYFSDGLRAQAHQRACAWVSAREPEDDAFSSVNIAAASAVRQVCDPVIDDTPSATPDPAPGFGGFDGGDSGGGGATSDWTDDSTSGTDA